MRHALAWLALVAAAGCSDQQTILDALASSDESVRERAIWTAAARGSDAVWAVPALVESLDHPESRVLAAWALAEIGPAAAAAGDALLPLLRDQVGQVRAAAAWALARIGRRDDDTRRALEALRDDPDVLTRQSAGAALRLLSAS